MELYHHPHTSSWRTAELITGTIFWAGDYRHSEIHLTISNVLSPNYKPTEWTTAKTLQ